MQYGQLPHWHSPFAYSPFYILSCGILSARVDTQLHYGSAVKLRLMPYRVKLKRDRSRTTTVGRDFIVFFLVLYNSLFLSLPLSLCLQAASPHQ
jgi:hypothetical protein